jgi:hypothetical protein
MHLSCCAGKVEIHKPLFENGLRDGFKRSIGLSVEFNFVVNRREDGDNAMLGGEGRKVYF